MSKNLVNNEDKQVKELDLDHLLNDGPLNNGN